MKSKHIIIGIVILVIIVGIIFTNPFKQEGEEQEIGEPEGAKETGEESGVKFFH